MNFKVIVFNLEMLSKDYVKILLNITLRYFSKIRVICYQGKRKKKKRNFLAKRLLRIEILLA